jgi:hypothetical protein
MLDQILATAVGNLHLSLTKLRRVHTPVSASISLRTASVFQWSEFFATDTEARVRFPALQEKKGSGSVTGSTQPHEYN